MRACEALTNIGVAQTFVDMGEIRMASDEVYQHQDYTHRHGDNYPTHNAQRVGLASKNTTFFDLGILIVCDHRCCSSAFLTSLLSSYLALSVSENTLHLALVTKSS